MDRNYRARFAGDSRFDLVNVDVVGQWIDIDEDRLGVKPGDSTPGGKGSVGSGDFLVAGLKGYRHQRDQQCIGTRRNADGKLALGVSRDFFFERLYFRAEDEIL